MIKDSQWFEFNNQLSSDYKIINCNLSSGMLEEPFSAEREIVETKIRGRNKPYFQEIEEKPLEFNLNFAFETGWTEESLQAVKRWLLKPYYAKLIFSEDPDKIYYGIFVSEPTVSHNGCNQGYFTCNFRCDGSYIYSPIYVENFDFSANTPNYFEFNNLGDIDVLPIVEITKVGAGGVSIFNLSDGNREFGFLELANNEVVEIDCLRRNIKSSLEASAPSIYRYDKLINDYYMNLPYGKNRLKVEGNCLLVLKYEFKFR